MKKCSYAENFIRLAKLCKWDVDMIRQAEAPQIGLVWLLLNSKNKDHVKYSKITKLDFKLE